MESTLRTYSAVNNYKLSPISSFLIIFEENGSTIVYVISRYNRKGNYRDTFFFGSAENGKFSLEIVSFSLLTAKKHKLSLLRTN